MAPRPPAKQFRPVSDTALFVVGVAIFVAGQAWRVPSLDVAIALVAASVVTALLLVALRELWEILTRTRDPAETPAWGVPGFMRSVRSSMGVLLFLYGILAGHFLWQ